MARAAAKIGAVQATARGLHGVFKRLSEEHKEISTLLMRAAMTSDIAKRAELWPLIRDELVAHEQAELQEVYPDFEWHPSLVDVVRTHEGDGARLQAFVRELDSLTFDSPLWHPTLLKLEAVVNAHAEREEELFFPRVQAILGAERVAELDARYLATRVAIRGIS